MSNSESIIAWMRLALSYTYWRIGWEVLIVIDVQFIEGVVNNIKSTISFGWVHVSNANPDGASSVSTEDALKCCLATVIELEDFTEQEMPIIALQMVVRVK
jgi:hypothetical protein